MGLYPLFNLIRQFSDGFLQVDNLHLDLLDRLIKRLDNHRVGIIFLSLESLPISIQFIIGFSQADLEQPSVRNPLGYLSICQSRADSALNSLSRTSPHGVNEILLEVREVLIRIENSISKPVINLLQGRDLIFDHVPDLVL